VQQVWKVGEVEGSEVAGAKRVKVKLTFNLKIQLAFMKGLGENGNWGNGSERDLQLEKACRTPYQTFTVCQV